MKIGDTYDVSLGGVKVTEARVTWMEDGIAELMFEGQRVKMSYTTQLAPEATTPVDQPVVEPSKQVIIDGVERRESAPVGGEVSAENIGSTTVPDAEVNVAESAATVVPVVESGPATLETPPEAAVAVVEPAEKPTVPEGQ